MRIVLQRVKKSSVIINSNEKREISQGLNLLVGISETDTEKEVIYLAKKCVDLRIFSDENDKLNLSVLDIGGAILAISNFTLYGDCKKGKRPSFIKAGRPEMSEKLYEMFVSEIKKSGLVVKTGEFGADMEVEIINDGPITIILDTETMLK
ncbi:MAG: D-aminoacyl-tRNA deacylase [Clostridia bacterium]